MTTGTAERGEQVADGEPGRAATVLAVDLGKTSCRVALVVGGTQVDSLHGAGTPGLAEPTGVVAAVATIAPLAGQLCRRNGVGQPAAVGIGAAGAITGVSDATDRLASAVAGALRAGTVVVASDAVAAHVGALGGGPGVVQIAGTGSVALGVTAGGRQLMVDGWGPLLGDEGSGGWLGLAGLRAAMRAHDGRGPATGLAAAAAERFGDLSRLPATLVAGGNPARVAADFCADVAGLAATGDLVAAGLMADAVSRLVDSTLAAVRAVRAESGEPLELGEPVAVAMVGGLAELMREPWQAALGGHAGLVRIVDNPGNGLAGAATLATRGDLPHEAGVHRLVLDGLPPAVDQTGPSTDPLLTDGLATEQVRPGLEDLDTRSAAELVDLILAAEAGVPAALAAAAPALTMAVELTVDALQAGGRLVYVGAGTPGRLAAVDAAEVSPTFGVPPQLVTAVIAGGSAAKTQAMENAEDDQEGGAADVTAHRVGPGDVVVGVSASGRTPYVLGALIAAREAGATTVSIVNNPSSVMSAAADVAIEVNTGAEVVAGSTRLTAGTAQKIVLNALSTATMVRLGKTYGAWMVDVQAGNHKLRRRALRILREASGADPDAAERALSEAGGQTPIALVALLLGVDTAIARQRLTAAGGRVRDAIRNP